MMDDNLMGYKERPVRYGYLCISDYTDPDGVKFTKGTRYPSYMLVGMPKAIKELHFTNNPDLRGDTRVQ